MDASKFTTRSQEAISAASQLATGSGHAQVEPAHLLAALLDQADGITRSLVERAGVDPATIVTALQSELKKLPAASGSCGRTG